MSSIRPRCNCAHTFRAERIDGISDLLDLVPEHLGGSAMPSLYWTDPQAGESLLAIGAVHAIRTAGADRFDAAAAEARSVLDALRPDGGGARAPRPRFVGGFGFSARETAAATWREFPPCWFFLPERTWLLKDGVCWRLSVSRCERVAGAMRSRRGQLPADAGCQIGESPSDRDGWTARVTRSLHLIRRGAIGKIVLSRQRSWLAAERPPVKLVLRCLREARPGCYTFWIGAGETELVGSTPELLVRRRGMRVATQALAGTSRRGAGARQDAALAEQLRGSVKNRREHAAVVRGIEDVLRPLCLSLCVQEAPRIITLPEAHHLHTLIRGDLRRPLGALDLAASLHPTPAVCGTPREKAQELLECEEPERGWFTGGVGWMDADGDGTFAVALRSALIDGPRLTVWAGAGIVEGSDPASELEETELKMNAMVEAIARAGVSDAAPLALGSLERARA